MSPKKLVGTLFHEGILRLKNVLLLHLLFYIILCVLGRGNPSLASVYCTCHGCLQV